MRKYRIRSKEEKGSEVYVIEIYKRYLISWFGGYWENAFHYVDRNGFKYDKEVTFWSLDAAKDRLDKQMEDDKFGEEFEEEIIEIN